MNQKRLPLIKIVVFIAVIVIIGIACFVIVPDMLRPRTDIRLGNSVFKAWIALNEDDRLAGLSKEGHINDSQALIMAFPEDDVHGVWMKGMTYPIDVVWLDSDKRVVYAIKNIPFEDQEKIYSPNVKSRYIVELKAGMVERQSIRKDTTAIFDINQNDIR